MGPRLRSVPRPPSPSLTLPHPPLQTPRQQAVKAALEGAKDMEGLQDTLAQIPEHLVVEICKNILAACKDLWPQLASHFDKLHGENPNCPFKLGLCAGAAGPIA
jgi:hypothetical protein